MKNLFVNMESGESILVYTEELTSEEVEQWVNICCSGNDRVVEVYHVPQEELQYYCIDGRVWVDTPEKVAKVRQQIA